MSDNLTLVHCRKIKQNLAISTEFPLQYTKQHDFSLKNEPPFCLLFFYESSFMHKTAGYDCGRAMSHISGNECLILQGINFQQVKMSVSQQIIEHRFTLRNIYLKSPDKTYPNIIYTKIICASINDPDCQLNYYLTIVSCHCSVVLITFDILMIIVDTDSYINIDFLSTGNDSQFLHRYNSILLLLLRKPLTSQIIRLSKTHATCRELFAFKAPGQTWQKFVKFW
jgi:hypothetical protein